MDKLFKREHQMKRKKRRTQRNKGKKRPPVRPARRKRVGPRTAQQFWAMSKHDRDEWEKVTSVVSEARASGKSPRKIAKRFGIEFKTVRRKAGRVIRKRNGRYVVAPTDKLLRVFVIPAKKGLREVATRDSRQATLVAGYWIAVHRYLESGDASGLVRFRGKYVTNLNKKKIR